MAKMKFMTQPWSLISVTTGVQICEGNRVIAYLGEPNSGDHGPRRTQDVMERANAIVAIPDLVRACEAAAKFAAQCQKAIEADDPTLLPNEAQRLQVENDCRSALAKSAGGEK